MRNSFHYKKRYHYVLMFFVGFAVGMAGGMLIQNIPLQQAFLNSTWYAITIVIISFVAFESGRHIKLRR